MMLLSFGSSLGNGAETKVPAGIGHAVFAGVKNYPLISIISMMSYSEPIETSKGLSNLNFNIRYPPSISAELIEKVKFFS